MIPTTNPGQAGVYYKNAVEQAARYEHAGDLTKRQEILNWIADFKIRWSAAGHSALDGTSGWQQTPRQFEARKRDLELAVDKAKKMGAEHWVPYQAELDAHLAHGQALGYLPAA